MICLLRQRNNNQTTEEKLSDSFFRFFSFLFFSIWIKKEYNDQGKAGTT